MYVTIDRFEGNFAIVELPDETFINVPKDLFPNAHEGDIFLIQKDIDKMSERKEKIRKLSDELFQ